VNFQRWSEQGSAALAESCAFFALAAFMNVQEMLGESQTAPSIWDVGLAKWIT
jgi:hypothetical protein